jgi:branched-chain amino acid transport system ATP-binding protein
LDASSSIHVERQSACAASADPVLTATGLRAGYRGRTVLHEVSVSVAPGQVVALLGHNGAGKTTLLRALCGLITPTGGRVMYQQEDVTAVPCHRKVAKGLVFLPSEQFTFGKLSVMDNLLLGGRMVSSAQVGQERLERVYSLFPILAKRSAQRAGTLSGGEQRMVSLAMALMIGPKVLLLDEPSLGLAPFLAQEIMSVVRGLADSDGLAVMLVEQAVALALGVADRAYVMRSGRVILEETCQDMRQRDRLWDLF